MKVLNKYFYNNSKLYLLLFLTVIEVVAFLSNANYFDILIYPVLLYVSVSYLVNNDSDYYILDKNGFLPFNKKNFIKRYNLQCVLFAMFGFIGNSVRLINGNYDLEQIIIVLVFNIVMLILFIVYTITIIKKTKYQIINDLSGYTLLFSYILLNLFEYVLVSKLEINTLMIFPLIIFLIFMVLNKIFAKKYADKESVNGLSGLISMEIIKNNRTVFNVFLTILCTILVIIVQSENFDLIDTLFYSSFVMALIPFIDKFKATYRDCNYLKIVPVKKKNKLLNILVSSLIPYLSAMFWVIMTIFLFHKEKIIIADLDISILLMIVTSVIISYSISIYIFYNNNNDIRIMFTGLFVFCFTITFVLFNAYFNYLLYLSTIISIMIVMKYIKYYI